MAGPSSELTGPSAKPRAIRRWGSTNQLLPGDENETDPSWAPDGISLVFGRTADENPSEVIALECDFP